MNRNNFIFINFLPLAFFAILLNNNSLEASYIRFASKTQQHSNWKDEMAEQQNSNGEYSYGSGKYDEYVESLRNSEKDDDFEGSAEGSADSPEGPRIDTSPINGPIHQDSHCLQMLQQANSKNIPGSFVPRCTFDGHFSPLQCHGGTGECWCSTRDGLQIPGSLKKDPQMTFCDKYDTENYGSTAGKQSKLFEGHSKAEGNRRGVVEEDIILKSVETKNNKGTKEILVPYDNIGGKKKKIMKESIRSFNDSTTNDESLMLSSLRLHSLLSQPGLLAAIVSLLLVVLLCVISVVVLSVCKLKHRNDKGEAKEKAHLECESVINGYNNNLTYATPTRFNNVNGEIYAGGGFSYTPGISPAKCQTMNLRMSPWAASNGYNTNKSSHLVYSKCAEQDMFA